MIDDTTIQAKSTTMVPLGVGTTDQINIPAGLIGAPFELDIVFSPLDQPTQLPGGRQLASAITDISVLNQAGESITSLDSALEICFEKLEASKGSGSACLGFYNVEMGAWECEDNCLEENKDGVLCGKTDHLTSFALLLGGKDGGSACGSAEEPAFVYLSIAFIGGACVIVVLSMIVLEYQIGRKKRRQHSKLRRLAKAASGHIIL